MKEGHTHRLSIYTVIIKEFTVFIAFKNMSKKILFADAFGEICKDLLKLKYNCTIRLSSLSGKFAI